jgi:uncharacterized protein
MYSELDAEAIRFAEASRLSCPAGCGKCCDHADTEVDLPEATLIADYILTVAPHLRQVLEERIRCEGGECVFYDRDSDLHCQIYPVRPLICRCFGYAAEKDKTGALLFPACQHMDLPAGLRAGGGVVRILFEPHPPVMAEYRERIGNDSRIRGRMRPLGDAVAVGLDR